MMMESKQARVFCVRLIHKLSEVFTGIKVGHGMSVSTDNKPDMMYSAYRASFKFC